MWTMCKGELFKSPMNCHRRWNCKPNLTDTKPRRVYLKDISRMCFLGTNHALVSATTTCLTVRHSFDAFSAKPLTRVGQVTPLAEPQSIFCFLFAPCTQQGFDTC